MKITEMNQIKSGCTRSGKRYVYNGNDWKASKPCLVPESPLEVCKICLENIDRNHEDTFNVSDGFAHDMCVINTYVPVKSKSKIIYHSSPWLKCNKCNEEYQLNHNCK